MRLFHPAIAADSVSATGRTMNFGFCSEGGKRAFYFHSAKEGRKIELIARNGHAGFELDTGYALKTGETACSHSARFQSVIGNGTVSFVEEAAEKEAALRLLMEHNTGRADWKFTPAMLDAVCVFRLDGEEIACKEHL